MNLLRSDQLLLLENLTYLPLTNRGSSQPFPSLQDFEGQSVADLLHSMDLSVLDDAQNYGFFMTGADWKHLLAAIKKDSDCMAMCIRETHIDTAEGGDSGFAVLLTHPSTGEAVLSFRGSATDSFAASTMLSTAQQENALAWYQSLSLDAYATITVIGHAKGGNKAKYISLLDDSVSRCVSFDGHGFSDAYMQRYSAEIAAQQHKIENHTVDGDYVSLLLNDIGATTFYQTQTRGKDAFFAKPCPHHFFAFQADGSYQMIVADGRAPEMALLADFLKQYLRTLSPKDKQQSLAVFGAVAEACFLGTEADHSTASAAKILDTLSDEKNTDLAAQFLAYTMRYIESKPSFSASARAALFRCGLQGLCLFFERFLGFMPPSMAADAAFSSAPLLLAATTHPLLFLNTLRTFLFRDVQLSLHQGQMQDIFALLSKLHFYHYTQSLSTQKQDSRSPAPATPRSFSVEPEALLHSTTTLRQLSSSLRQTKTELQNVQMELSLFFWRQQRKLKGLSHQLEDVSDLCACMDGAISQVGGRFRDTQQSTCGGHLEH